MRKMMVLITIGAWLLAGAAVATDGRGKPSSSAGTVKSRESNVISRFEAKGNETLSAFMRGFPIAWDRSTFPPLWA